MQRPNAMLGANFLSWPQYGPHIDFDRTFRQRLADQSKPNKRQSHLALEQSKGMGKEHCQPTQFLYGLRNSIFVNRGMISPSELGLPENLDWNRQHLL
ncbi:MAG: hypothetical protein AAF664_07975, partial [Planctomycetota bacterium]